MRDYELMVVLSPDLDEGGARREWFLRVIETLKARSKLLGDLTRVLQPFLSDRFEYRPEAVEKYLRTGGKGGGPRMVADRMRALRTTLAGVAPFNEERTEQALRRLAESRGEPAAPYIHPLRVALVGTAVSPGIFTILSLIGKDRAMARLDRLVGFLDQIDTPPPVR